MRRLKKVSLFSFIVFAFATLAYFIDSAIYAYRATLPVHQIDPMCYGLRVSFTGPKSAQFIAVMERPSEYSEEPYITENDQVYTTRKGLPYPGMKSIVLNILMPGWSLMQPKPLSPEVEELVNAWKEKDEAREDARKEWCHVVEAAVAKNGIDVEARRKHPNIWPPDVWPVPPEPE